MEDCAGSWVRHGKWRHLLPPRMARCSKNGRIRVSDMKVFVPVTEELMERLGLSMDDLVPFDLDYEVLRPGVPFDAEATPEAVEPA